MDTGCGRGGIGRDTLIKHVEPLAAMGGKPRWVRNPKRIVFANGNGTKNRSLGVVELLADLGGKRFSCGSRAGPSSCQQDHARGRRSSRSP